MEKRQKKANLPTAAKKKAKKSGGQLAHTCAEGSIKTKLSLKDIGRGENAKKKWFLYDETGQLTGSGSGKDIKRILTSAKVKDGAPSAGRAEFIKRVKSGQLVLFSERLTEPLTPWDPRSMTAIAHYRETDGMLPPDKRAFADEVHRADRRYYNALAQYQSRKHQSIGDLFPMRPEARGGAITKLDQRADLSPEEALVELNRQKEAARLRMANLRAKRRAETKKPK